MLAVEHYYRVKVAADIGVAPIPPALQASALLHELFSENGACGEFCHPDPSVINGALCF